MVKQAKTAKEKTYHLFVYFFKKMVKQAKTAKEKTYHLFVYFFKIALTLVFCVAFVTVYSKVFGSNNSIVGVVVLLSVMTFRFADFGIHAPHAMSSLMIIWAIMTFGPRLANAGNLFTELLVNIVCIFVLMVLGEFFDDHLGNHDVWTTARKCGEFIYRVACEYRLYFCIDGVRLLQRSDV